MADPSIGVPAGSGFVGVVIGWFSGWLGFRARVSGLEKNVSDLKKNVRFTDTCKATHEGVARELKDIKASQQAMQTELLATRDGVSTLLERTKDL